MNTLFKRTRCAIVAFVMMAASTPVWAVGQLVIESVYADLEGDPMTLTIVGVNFDNGGLPVVKLFGYGNLTVLGTPTATEIVAALPEDVLVGDYVLTVTTNGGTPRTDSIDVTLGATGAQGPPGPQGPPGADGQDGADGAQGPPGPQGLPGADGQDGADGADGAQGPPGADGQDGADGADGAQGPPGPQGPAGTASVTIRTASIAGGVDALIIANCLAGEHAIAGGAQGSMAADPEMVSTYPSNSVGTAAANGSTNPTSWTAYFKSTSGTRFAFAVCVPN